MRKITFNTKTISRIVAFALAIMVGFAIAGVAPEEVSAAAKKPAKVTNLKTVEKTADTIKVKWKKQGKVSGNTVKYKVSYKQEADKKWSSKTTKNATYAISGLTGGTKYQIKVRAYYKKSGKYVRGKFSKVISAKTKGVSKDDLEKYTEELTQNGVPEEAVDDVLTVLESGEDVTKVEVTEKRKINGTQVVIGKVYYENKNGWAEFVVVGDTVYSCFEPKILESATLIINHQEVTVKTGKSVKVPNAAGTGYLEIHDVLVEGKKENPIVDGVTDEGGRYHAQTGWYWYDNSGSYDMAHVPEGDFDYSIRKSTWDLPTNGGNHMYVYSNHPDINIYWTCDGTEPVPGQEDLFGKCRWTRMTGGYLRGIVNNPKNPLENAYKKTQLRGTTSYGEKQVVFPENNSIDDENKFWIKAYAGNKLIYEEFLNPSPNGYETPPFQSGWKDVIWEKYAELLEYEAETYGPETPGEL